MTVVGVQRNTVRSLGANGEGTAQRLPDPGGLEGLFLWQESIE